MLTICMNFVRFICSSKTVMVKENRIYSILMRILIELISLVEYGIVSEENVYIRKRHVLDMPQNYAILFYTIDRLSRLE